MTRVTIYGKEYLLKFDLGALEQVEEAFDGLQGLMAAMRGKYHVRSLKTIFRILANRGEISQGREATVTGDEILGLTMDEMEILTGKITAEISAGRKTTVGIAGDGGETVEEIGSEDDEKNGRTGIS